MSKNDKSNRLAGKSDQELARLWVARTGNQLWDLFTLGISEHLEKIDDGITSTWQDEVRKLISKNFQVNKNELDTKFIKKLTNATLAAGAQGYDRVIETLSEWNLIDFKSFSKSRIDEFLNLSYSSNTPKVKASNEIPVDCICEICTNSLENEKFVIVEKKGDIAHSYFDVVCFISRYLREKASEYRNAKYAFYKQAKSVRAIMVPQQGTEKLRNNKELLTYDDYLAWRSQLIEDWTQQTTLQPTQKKHYQKDFIDYTNQVLVSHFTSGTNTSILRAKLDKHFENLKFESILEKYIGVLIEQNTGSSSSLQRNFADKKADYFLGSTPVDVKKLGQLSQFPKIAESVRSGFAVMLEITPLPKNQRMRLGDYIFGLIHGSGVKVQKISENTFFISKPETQLFGSEFKYVDAKSTEAQIGSFFS